MFPGASSGAIYIAPSQSRHQKPEVMIVKVFLIGYAYVVIRAIIGYYDNKDEIHVCETQPCIETAQTLLDAIDDSVHPCVNFYKFACGNFIRKNPAVGGTVKYGTLDMMNNRLSLVKKRLLEAIKYQEFPVMVKAKRMYQICMHAKDETPVLKEEILKLGGFPMVAGPQWNGSNFDIFQNLVYFQQLGHHVFLGLFVTPDVSNTTTNVIEVHQGQLAIGREVYGFSDEVAKYTFDSNKKFMAKVITSLGAAYSNVLFNQMANDVINFERRLANVSSSKVDQQNSSRTYNKMTISNLQNLSDPQTQTVNWTSFIREALTADDVSSEEAIVVTEVDYIKDMIDLINSTKKETIANYMIWSYIKFLSHQIFGPVNMHRFSFLKEIGAQNEDDPRYEKCIPTVDSFYGQLLGRTFARDKSVQILVREVERMAKNIQNVLIHRLERTNFMDDSTRKTAIDKIKQVRMFFGFPSWVKNDSLIEAVYRMYPDLTDSHLRNYIDFLSTRIKADNKFLRRSNDKNLFYDQPLIANAHYVKSYNSLTIPFGMFQHPSFQVGRPWAANFGALGMIVGHELIHGFDHDGRKYDEDGNLNNWWSEPTEIEFNKRAKCFVKQYNDYCPLALRSGNPICIKGEQTLGENMADNGGLEVSFQAWKNFETNLGKNSRLPGMENYTMEQIFFISYANLFCESTNTFYHLNSLLSEHHPPSYIRVNGALSNSKEFAKTFNCPIGQMNRGESECVLW